MLTESQIEHLAGLARLDLPPAKKQKYAEQLSQVLVYFSQLDELNTEQTAVTNHITGLQNITRADKVSAGFSAEQTLAMAPEIEDREVKVPAVFE